MKLKWKHDYGDHEETDDWVLWVNGKATNNYISECWGIYYCYIDDMEVDMLDTLKDAKERIQDELGH